MDINRKLDLAEQHIRSISQHDDVDAGVRDAVLARLIGTIKTEQAGMKQRVQAKVDAALQAPAK